MNEEWKGRLECRTRGDSKPNNKPNVYFSTHPEDFPIYFDLLAQEILKYNNCAIWYGTVQRDMDDPEHLMDLDQMQLFVFPITTRFLENESVAQHEFRYALKKQIPVLPIAVEKGLEKRFMDAFGSLQLIDRTSEDLTAMGYEERLSRFLSSVLISDETAQRIREAFDAFVFLSYRKKDRAYAHELMHLIHKSEVWERIGIWYDEFLVPGKDFDEEISDNLRKCRAFVLSVTASLIEDEKNYIERIEYPAAKELGMPIFPFLLQETDLEALQRRYPGCPDCVNVEDSHMTEYLLESHKQLAIKPKAQDAIHNFFIGLAYLGGIGVERDIRRAKKLISGAAEEGLPEAMEKLVTMYRNGEGIERDYDEALNWQIRYADRMKQLTKANPSGENRLRLAQAMQNLILYCLEQNRARDAKEYCEELVELAQRRFPEEEETANLLFAFFMRPRIEQYLEMPGESTQNVTELYLKCCAFCKEQYEEKKSDLALQILAQCYLELGRITSEELQLTLAREFYEKGIGYCRHLIAEDAEPRYSSVLSMLLSECASVEVKLNRYNRCREDLNEALALTQARYDEHLEPDDCEKLAALHLQMGRLLLKTEDIPGAKQQYVLAEELYKNYQQQTRSIQADLGLIDLYDGLADLHIYEKQYELAMADYQKEEEITEAVAQRGYGVDLSFIYWRIRIGMGMTYEESGRFDDELHMYLSAYEIAERIPDVSKTWKKARQICCACTADLICEFAKKHNMPKYAREFGRIRKKLDQMPSMPSLASMKELWSRDLIPEEPVQSFL